MKQCRLITRTLATLLLVVFTACQDQSPADPTGPDIPPPIVNFSSVENPEFAGQDGLFFFRPPTDEDEIPVSLLDKEIAPIQFLEVCRTEELTDFDPTTDVCPEDRLLARWDDSNAIFGQTITIESTDDFDFYQVVLKFNQFPEEDLPLGVLHHARVMLGVPDTEGAFKVPGWFRFVFVENASEKDFESDPNKVQVGDLPTKWYIDQAATQQLFCTGTLACTFEVIDVNAEEADLCYPENNCDLSNGLSAGVKMKSETLTEIGDQLGVEAFLAVIENIDLGQTPNPLGVGLPQVEEFIDFHTSPAFETLRNPFTIQFCIEEAPNQLAFEGAHLMEVSGVVQFLAEGPLGDLVFSQTNCDDFVPIGTLASAGMLERVRYAALNNVLRPVARFLGPRPLRAFDGTSWLSTDAESPFGPALLLGPLPNESPDPIEVAGETITVSVCVATQPHVDDDSSPPGPGQQLGVLFKVTEGSSGSIVGSDPDGTKTVTTELVAKEEGDECTFTTGDDPEQIAKAAVDWILSSDAELNELVASIPGTYERVVVDEVDGQLVGSTEPIELTHTFSTTTVERLAMCPTPDPESTAAIYDAFDEFGHRGFYILPTTTEFSNDGGPLVGDDLQAIQIRLSSSTKSNGLAGTYVLELSARRGSYDPDAQVATTTATVTLDGNAPEMKPVMFTFDEPIELFSGDNEEEPEELAFVATILEAPKKNARLWFSVPDEDELDGFPQKGDAFCTGAIVTNGTTFTTPLDTDRRQGMYIEILGQSSSQ